MADGCRNLLPFDGSVWCIDPAFEAEEAATFFTRLRDEIDWRQEQATLFGRAVALPRLTAWYGDIGYVYSGVHHEPRRWPPLLAELRARVEQLADAPFNGVLLNFYRDGRDHVSWHADNEPALGAEPTIASLSFGAERTFQLKHRKSPGNRVDIKLRPGSCLIMADQTQHFWVHRLPKAARIIEPRINLTFRFMHREPAPAH